MHAHELQDAAGEQEAVARLHAADERFLHAADAAAAHILHLHLRVRHDGPDPHAVAPADLHVGHAVDALLVRQHALVLRIDRQALAAARDEIQRPLPFFRREVAVRPRAFHFLVKRFGTEAAAQRDGDEVLHEHVERLVRHLPRLDAARGHGALGARRFQQFQAVRRHERHARDAARRVAAAARPLQQPRDALGAAHLQHALDGQEIDAEVQARRAHDGFQVAPFEARLDPFAHLAVERAVVQRDEAGPVRARLDDVLVPQLRLRARVREDQRRFVPLDLVDDRLQHLQAQVAGPRKARHALRHEAGHGPVAIAPCGEHLRDRRVRIAKQTGCQRACLVRRHAKPREESGPRRRVRLEAVARVEQIAFAQQAARLVRKTREEEMLRQLQARMHRRQRVAALDPRLGAEAFVIDPHGTGLALRHRGDIARRDVDAEEFDDDVGHIERLIGAVLAAPVQDAHAVDHLLRGIDVDGRPDAAETGEIIDPQGHRDAMLAVELPREAPADADVAEVVDHLAEDGERRGALIVVHGREPKEKPEHLSACAGGLLRSLTGVPTGIRTPVLTVKG